MAFKMKGNPMQRNFGIGNPKNFARKQKLKAGKLLKSEHEDTAVIGGGSDSDDLYDRIDFIKETANNEGRDLTNAEKADIKSIKDRIKDTGPLKKFYGDRTRKEMRQDHREHMDSLGDDRQAKKEARKYHRGRKKELRAEELERRVRTKRAERKMRRGKKITDQFREDPSAMKNYKKGYYGE